MDQTTQSALAKLQASALGAQAGAAPSSGVFMGLTVWGLIAGLFFSLAGLFYFRMGRRDSDLFTLLTGLALMLFPYFISNTLYVLAIGFGIMAFHYYKRNYE